MKMAVILVGMVISIILMDISEASMQHTATNLSFQSIEQSLPVKISVVLGGLTLVSAELWWFLGRK
jgi:plastocyanin domain-containing protein